MRFGGFQKTTLLDYPGRVASIVFVSGCNMRCGYCYNVSLALGKPPVVSETGILAELLSRKKWIDSVVVSGGEPTVWIDLPAFLRRLKDAEFNVKLDTNGSNPEMLSEIFRLKLVDYVAMDVKAPWMKYKDITGVCLQSKKIQESVQLIKAKALDYEFRTTAAPGLTESDLEEIALQIAPAKRWFLQPFVSSGPVLDPLVLRKPLLKEHHLKAVVEKTASFFDECSLRGSALMREQVA